MLKTALRLSLKSSKMIGLPKQVYSDEGGEFKAKEFADKMKYYDVEHQFSRTPPAFVERIV